MNDNKRKKLLYLLVALMSAVPICLGIIFLLNLPIEKENQKLKEKNLSKIIIENKKNLETIKTSGLEKPTEEQIKNLLGNKFDIDINKIQIKNITSTTAKVISDDNKVYTGEVTINYIIDKSINLDYLVPNIKNRKKVETFRNSSFSKLQDIVKNLSFLTKNGWFKKYENLSDMNKFIHELDEKLIYKANQESINEFNKIKNNTDNFSDFANLNEQFKDEAFVMSKSTLVGINWEFLLNLLLNNNERMKDKIKENLVYFYNIMAKVYGKNNLMQMVEKIDLQQPWTKNLAYVEHPYNNRYNLKTIVLNYSLAKRSYEVILWTIVHEYGHMLDFFCNNVWIKTLGENYMINSLAENTRITDDNYKKLLAYGIIRSNYGTTSYKELFAEAFANWIVTPEENRDVAWEKLDKFFRIDLPKMIVKK
ncbi:hypothetical protein [Spiroplasma endosymbiont of Asaphidion curtum]|uniref:hypothetical protein n=1 Tax=Spiroplasma endosymbiont of Asaphidion curtum TaxID=3066281 RepID=UPI00313D3A9A